MSVANRMNIGILGCSRFAIRSMIPAIVGLPDLFHLTGIASRSLTTAKQPAEAFRTRAFEGYQALLDAPGLEAVYIPLPNALHAEWTERALDRGLHVLVEKPLACTLEEAARVHEMARTKKRVLLENFHFRFHRQLAWAQDVISSGRIGKIRCIRSSFGFPPLEDRQDIRYQRNLGGGALLDAGVYPIKMAQILMGEDISATACRLVTDPERGVDLWGGAFLAQKQGDLFAEIAFGFDHHYQCSLEVWGSQGMLTMNRIFTCPRDVKPVAIIETGKGKEIQELPADNQIQNLLIHFHRLSGPDGTLESEYRQNLDQARLIEELRQRAHES